MNDIKQKNGHIADYLQAAKNNQVWVYGKEIKGDFSSNNVEYVDENAPTDCKIPVFVINEDLTNFVDVGPDEMVLPFDELWVVLNIDNQKIIARASNSGSGNFKDRKVILPYIKENDGSWRYLAGSNMLDANGNQISSESEFAVRIMNIISTAFALLEAEVCKLEKIEAPQKLNKKRLKNGNLPLNDYHVIQLGHQYQGYTPHGANDEPSYRVRLHFRRGHWRKTTDSGKIWIKWCLVGDPALGFVEKHYQIT